MCSIERLLNKAIPEQVLKGCGSMDMAGAGRDRREELIATTVELLLEQGLSAVRTRDVTSRAGVGVGLLNHYFQWGELRALALGRVLDEGVLRVIPEPGTDPRAALEHFVSLCFNPATDSLWRLWIEAVDASLADEGIRAVTEAAAVEMHGRLERCLAAGAAAGLWQCPDAGGAALRLLAAQDGFSGFVLGGVPEVSRATAEAHFRHLISLECPEP
jgi:AcrR family transcriptional regulator